MTVPVLESTLEEGLLAYLSDLGWATTRAGLDLQTLVQQHGAVIVVKRSGGSRSRLQLIARLTVEVYVADTEDAHRRLWDVSEEVSRRLVGSRARAGRFLLDRGVCESAPSSQPHPNLRMTAGSYRVTTRTL